MPIKHRDIKEAFRRRFMDFPGTDNPLLADAPPLPQDTASVQRFAWEGENFSPPATGLWFRESYIPADETLAATDLFEASGIYQIDIYTPQGEGVREVEDLADALKTYFAPGGFVDPESGVQVAVDKAERSRASVDRSTVSVGQNFPWLNISVSITWRSYASEE